MRLRNESAQDLAATTAILRCIDWKASPRMRSTSIGVEYLEMRELGFLSPMSTSSLQRLYTLGEN